MTALTQQDLLWTLGSICQLNRVPFDARLAAQDLPPPHGVPALLEGLQRLGFEVSSRSARTARLARLPTPFLALVGGASAAIAPVGAAKAATAVQPALILRIEADRILYFPAGTTEPVQSSLDEFTATYTGRIIQFRRQAESPSDLPAI